MESALDYQTARAMLEWQIELGATEAILDSPVNRYEAVQKPAPTKPATAAPVPEPQIDPVAIAKTAAAAANDLQSLKTATAHFDHCSLKRGARSLVFADGQDCGRVMIIGEAPDREEDRSGTPFVGQAGRLLDRMLAAIGLDRNAQEPDKAVYLTNILPWRPPQSRDASAHEIAMMRPFVQRHVALVNPDILILMGNSACHSVLEKRGINRLRGVWTEAYGKPTLPMLHPETLLRTPVAKREAWSDLLKIKARLAAIT
ncbi:uracil-DNA glycosylase [Cognatishimia sp. WU-CL00825]|uniref:uracil-DNA glycosylase n=1 Tax=Cognatishimia sp. WU-CL00825 TaxID=3127658 RepID=UPI00310BA840